MLQRCLAPDGRVFFVDSRREPTSTAVDHRLPPPEATWLTRRLNDGREFRICKIFHDPGDLTARLAALGWNAAIRATDHYFIHGACRVQADARPPA
jgi:demethylmenaquinone methyltransferase/2-methoxy-6-polyprenyl-1,4-benzoquinol methylase